MSDINLAAIDLNLLVALDALLTEQGVTRAARRVGVGQSAMSHALGRLRELLGDPLLVRVGRRMEPTPRAVALQQPLQVVLAELRRLLGEAPDFDPTTSTRTFRIACPDLFAALLPSVLATLGEVAPGVRLEVQALRGDLGDRLLSGRAELALSSPQPPIPGLMQRQLARLDWASWVRRDHPLAADGDDDLTLEQWTAWPHIVVRSGSESPSRVGQALGTAGRERTVGLVLPGFLAAPWIVARTDFIFTGPRALIAPLATPLGLVARRPPLDIAAIEVLALWPQRLQADPGHQWLRSMMSGAIVDALPRA